jgi:uncharacterized protein
MSNQRPITVGWFEIPVTLMERAIIFYETVFDTVLSKQSFGDTHMAWFPFNEQAPGAGGTLILSSDHYTPSHKGTLIYFSSDDVSIELNRVEQAGGILLQPKTEISPDIGFMGIFEDSEGNRIALHSKK